MGFAGQHFIKGGDGMSLRLWLQELFGGGSSDPVEITCADLKKAMANYEVRNLAFWIAVDRIARSLAKCEIKTYIAGQEQRGMDYYRLNIAPNKNANGASWLHRLVSQLYLTNEALVVEIDGQLVIADGFNKTQRALADWSFDDVHSDGFTFGKVFFMPEVFYFRLNNEDVRGVVNGVYEAYAEMLEVAKSFHSAAAGTRGILNINAQTGGSAKERENQLAAISNRFKALSSAKDAVVPLPAGYTYTDLTKGIAGADSRDYREMINDVLEMTALAFGIPPVLMRGEVAGIDEIYNVYLADCIDPLAALLQAEINKKLYGYDGYAIGNRVEIDTSKVKHFELLEAVGKLDKAIASGVMTINEARKVMGLSKSDDPACDKHFITKNYGEATEVKDDVAS